MPNLKAKYIIDENGDRVAPITYIDAVRDSNGDSLSDLMVPEKLGSGIGTCSTSSGTALTVSLADYELVQNGFVAVTFENDVPANATLNVNGKGAKPIIYKGSAIEADVIKADDTVTFCYDGSQYVVTSLGGEGGSVTLVEYLSINLTSEVATLDPALVGATVVVTDDDNSETILSTTWQGTTLECTIDVGINYTITLGDITDYVTPSSRTFKARAGYTRTEVFEYNAIFVDFELPSGLLWARYNVGASKPSDIGLFFSWGNIIGYAKDSWPSNYDYSKTPGYSLTNDIPSGSATYDAARAIMGGDWRMPSRAELVELVNNTDSEWATIDGVGGRKFMKKSDHSIYIFMPVTGRYNNGMYQGYTTGYYYSTNGGPDQDAYNLQFSQSGINPQTLEGYRSFGEAIRAVK